MAMSNDANCLGGQLPMGSDAAAQMSQTGDMIGQQAQTVNLQYHQHHLGHHDQYGGYMTSQSQGPVQTDSAQQFGGNVQQQWYVQQQHPQHMNDAPGAQQQQQQQQNFAQQMSHQSAAYHHHQQSYHHMGMGGNPNATNSWAAVANNMNSGMPGNMIPDGSDPKVKMSKVLTGHEAALSEESDEGKKRSKKRASQTTKKKHKTAKSIKAKSSKRDEQTSKAMRSGRTKTVAIQELGDRAAAVGMANCKEVEGNFYEVSAQFEKGCDCMDHNCFEGLDPEAVYKHRLNIDELSKLEHDMYLMGITMACLESPDETLRQKERKRLRSKFRFKGKDVCVNAFLFLEHTTLHQLKSIRKHLRDHGVTPRIHGNHRKRPHNSFSLDIYQQATKFLLAYFEKNSFKEATTAKKRGLICLPTSITCKKIHSEYEIYCQRQESGDKFMGYSTFRHFLKEQFPHLRFHKDEVPKSSE